MAAGLIDAYCDAISDDGRSIDCILKFEPGRPLHAIVDVLHFNKDHIGHAIIEHPSPDPSGTVYFTIRLTASFEPIEFLTRQIDIYVYCDRKPWTLRFSQGLVESLIQRRDWKAKKQLIQVFFSSDPASELHRLATSWTEEPSEPTRLSDLSRLMRESGSDKSGDWHNYTLVYEPLFAHFRNEPFNLLEVGIGTNNLDMPSNMGPNGVPGASLRAWRNYFPNASIFGADIDERILFSEERIVTTHVDQTDPNSIALMWERLPAGQFRLIIDDGLHTFEANETLLRHSLRHLASGGFYVIEDILLQPDNLLRFKKLLAELGHAAVLLILPYDQNTYDNCLAIIQVDERGASTIGPD